MGSDEKTRDAASEAVVALRKAMGQTQQQFATETAKTAITTVARWETGNPPPRGGVLLRLANIADEHGHKDLRDEFLWLYLGEVLENVKYRMIVRPADEGLGDGYLVLKLKGIEQIKAALKFVSTLPDRKQFQAETDRVAKSLEKSK